MNQPKLGLSEVPTSDLKKFLRAIHRQEVPFPLTRSTVMTMGMNRLANACDPICGLDERATRAVLICVLAERM